MATWTVYNAFKLSQLVGTSSGGSYTAVNLSTGTLKVMLVTTTTAPVVGDVFRSDRTNAYTTNEVSGTNYTAGGKTLANKTFTQNNTPTTGTVHFSNSNDADTTWAQSSGGFSTARYAVLYNSTGSAATDQLIAFSDLTGSSGTSVGNVAGSLTLQIAANEIFTLQ
jgi:hypothetical protein